MAESATYVVAQKLSDLLVQKAVLLKGVEGQVEWLRDELQRMQCFLKDADAKQEEDEGVKNWVSEIRNAAYEAEDIIDIFILKIESQKKKGFFGRYTRILKEVNDRRKVGKQIEWLKVKLQEICGSRERYGIRSIEEGIATSSTAKERLKHLRRSSPLGIEKDPVGLQKDAAQLVAQLLKEEDRVFVISIVGMGGIGKTTLAKRVFNHDAVRVHFNCHAWAFVSQDCRPKDILQTIIRQVTGKNIECSQEEELETMLYEHMQEKCYLVVLDDIWTTESWDVLERTFPKTNNRSKLLLTTRNRDVAQRAAAQSISHELRVLSKDDSWELFLRKAFVDEADTSTCPPELEEVAREIVKKCYGLPLAIVVIGGLLSRKRLVSEWGRVLNNIDSHFARDQIGVLPILALSYSDLPHYLKSCFLHLGLFPEDYVISVRKLIHLWIAEGLIPQRAEKRMESIAEEYLNELAERNMVQVVRTSANNRIKQCQIHDLLRDLSISKGKDEIFLEIHGETYFAPSVKSRHRAIYSNFDGYFHSKLSTPHLRSVLLFCPEVSVLEIFSRLNVICTNFNLLRVLDLENIWVGSLPSEVGQLVNLRYLGLRNTGINWLPSSMKYLQSLQMLDISHNDTSDKIPSVICKMENLRHLYMDPLRCAGQLKIDTLRHLQTLLYVGMDNWKQNNSANLASLLKLGLVVTPASDVDEFINSIAKLEQLSSLYLRSDSEFGNDPSLTCLSHLCRVTKLRMEGPMAKLSQLNRFPPNLTQLTLIRSHLNQPAMSILKELPKLSILILRNDSYVGGQLRISATWFPLLQFLELKGLSNLKELIIENGAMPRLRCFRILSCKRLKLLYLDRTVMSALQELQIADTGLQINEAEAPSYIGTIP